MNNSLVLHMNTTICLRYSPALACLVAFSMLSIRDLTERRLSWREMPALCCRRTAAISCCTDVSRELLESVVITGNCVGMFGPAAATVGCFCDATTDRQTECNYRSTANVKPVNTYHLWICSTNTPRNEAATSTDHLLHHRNQLLSHQRKQQVFSTGPHC